MSGKLSFHAFMNENEFIGKTHNFQIELTLKIEHAPSNNSKPQPAAGSQDAAPVSILFPKSNR